MVFIDNPAANGWAELEKKQARQQSLRAAGDQKLQTGCASTVFSS